jgi:hypothetical protein
LILRGPGKISQVRIFDRNFIRAGQVLTLFTQFRPDYFLFIFYEAKARIFFQLWVARLFILFTKTARPVSFRFVRFRFVLFDFVSFRSVSFRFALYKYPLLTVGLVKMKS